MANDVYIDIIDNQTPVSQATFNQLQKLIKTDIQNIKIETLKLVFPIRKYICNTRRYKSIYNLKNWYLAKG